MKEMVERKLLQHLQKFRRKFTLFDSDKTDIMFPSSLPS